MKNFATVDQGKTNELQTLEIDGETIDLRPYLIENDSKVGNNTNVVIIERGAPKESKSFKEGGGLILIICTFLFLGTVLGFLIRDYLGADKNSDYV